MNDPDLQLLRTDPTRLILNYQDLVKAIVRKYVSSGLFRTTDFQDVVQTVNMELWSRIPRIRTNYNGRALVRTYISAIIRNICLRLHEKNGSVPPGNRGSVEEVSGPDGVLDRYSLQQAKRVFRAIFSQFHYHLPRIVICLKLRYRIPLISDDILRWHPECPPAHLSSLLSHFGGDYTLLKDKEIFARLTPIFNSIEKKRNSDDALRKWTLSKLQEITDLLRTSLPEASFDEESVEILLEDYFSPFLLKE